MSFHEVRFPTAISRSSSGGPERLTEIVTLGSGREERNTRWSHSRRRYNAGFGVKSLDDIQAVVAFFEERRGRLHGFRWKDHADFRSGASGAPVTATDQLLGTGDGINTQFQLTKVYGSGVSSYARPITKPVNASVAVSVDGVETTNFTLDPVTGLLILDVAPASAALVRAGFEFDVPVRFDTDRLEINLANFTAGEIPDIPVLEVRL